MKWIAWSGVNPTQVQLNEMLMSDHGCRGHGCKVAFVAPIDVERVHQVLSFIPISHYGNTNHYRNEIGSAGDLHFVLLQEVA